MLDDLSKLTKAQLIEVLQKLISNEPGVEPTPVSKKDMTTMRRATTGSKTKEGQKYCRIEPFVPKQTDNLFLKMKGVGGKLLKDNFKKDTRIDKKLAGDNEPTERGERQAFYEMECEICKQVVMVPTAVASQYNRDIEYKCEKCQKGK